MWAGSLRNSVGDRRPQNQDFPVRCPRPWDSLDSDGLCRTRRLAQTMKRRGFLMKSIGLASPAAGLLPGAKPALAQNSAVSGRQQTSEPRVFVRDEGRHAAGMDQFEPPLAASDVTLSADQLAGSGVDTLFFSAGVEGGTVIYDSRVAQKLGDNVDKWTHPVHYRDARHIRQLIADGHDRLKLLCDRCHEKGIWLIASLCIDAGGYISPRGHGRTSDFVFNNPQFQVGPDDNPRARELSPTRLSFMHPEVRQERFRIFEELLSRYETDGVEVFAEFLPPCKLNQVAQLAPIFTQWLRDLRSSARKAEQAQRRRKRIYVYLPARRDSWKDIGYDVAAWLSENLVDGLVCAGGVAEMHDQDLELGPAVQQTRGTACRVLAACHSGVGKRLEKRATQPMIWAAAANAYDQGADGFGLDHPQWFTWPWRQEEYETLRLLGRLELLATADKLYWVQSSPKGSPLPRVVEEGQPVTVSLRVADDLARWHSLGRVRSVRLRVRVTNIDASLSVLTVALNGQVLPSSLVEPNDFTYRIVNGSALGPYGYRFEYNLAPAYYPKRGRNTVQVTLVKKDPGIDLPFEIFDVDCQVRYRLHRHFEQDPVLY